MAKYDHGGGCACGLQRYCDCSSNSQANGKTPAQERAEEAAAAERGHIKAKSQCCNGRCRGKPGCVDAKRNLDKDDIYARLKDTMRASPQSRARAERARSDYERSEQRRCELAEDARIAAAVAGLSSRARKLWDRVKDPAHWYKTYEGRVPQAMDELVKAGLVGTMGRRPLSVSCFVPVGTAPGKDESYPEDMP